ncbi:MAG TPA: polyphosphate kinase 1 [Anaerolineae bacterium]|nr:polyphosphate kinase 1 [Anaerolineae bacterium]
MTKKKSELRDAIPAVDLNDPRLFINRELSWLKFNERVLEEALDERHPLLERVKFLAIYANNLDEFFMIRVSGLLRQLRSTAVEAPPDGMSPADQLAAIRRELRSQLTRHMECWRYDVLPKLKQHDITILSYSELKGKQRKLLRRYFERFILPILTPLAVDPGHPFPHISNLSINLAVVVRDPFKGERYARLKLPDEVLPRLVAIPAEEEAEEHYELLGLTTTGTSTRFVWLEEIVAANLDLLFPEMEVVAAYPFRVTRDADIEVEEDQAGDLLAAITQSVAQRRFGSVVRLEIGETMPARIRDWLAANLDVQPFQVDLIDGPLGLKDLMSLTRIERPELKDAPFAPWVPPQLSPPNNIFEAIRKQEFLLYHPYDSFSPVVDFLRQAAVDPEVLAIKQTLYRTGNNSPVVDALLTACRNGKQVAVLVEIKARGDEENNIDWAEELEEAGVHVVYGLVGFKTHAKVCLVVRREGNAIQRYVHLATGNYNAVTSRVYADLGFFTTNPDFGADATEFFNALTGYSRQTTYRKLLVAPSRLREELLARIEREIARHAEHGDGYLAFKMNALVDQACIQALYRASQAGVKVDLQVRGICCLRPNVPGVSENITVTSVVGRFLEHARIYYFRNGGDEELFLGSADLMPRNLDRRVETLFPIEDPALRARLRDHVLFIHLRDNVQARQLQADGSYVRLAPAEGEPEINSQQWMLEHRGLLSSPD